MVAIDQIVVRLDPGTNGDPRIKGYADVRLGGSMTLKSMRITMHRRTGKISVHPPNKRLTVPCPRCRFGVCPRDRFCCACGVPLDLDTGGYPYVDVIALDRKLWLRVEHAVLLEYAAVCEGGQAAERRLA